MGKTTEKPAETPAPASNGEVLGKALWALLWATVDAQINGDKNHGWVAADSMAVIEAVVNEDASLSKVGDVTKYTMSDECLKMVQVVVNPSSFRQQLEDQEPPRLTKSENKRQGSLKKLASQFGEAPKAS